MKIETLEDLFLDEIRDMYSAETQLVDALPELAEEADDEQLEQAFREHLTETQGHVQQLEKVCEILDEKPEGETCEAMKGLVKEAKSMIKDLKDRKVADAALITCAQKVEHYEIASYGALIAIANQLGHTEIAEILSGILDEEKDADALLTRIAEGHVNEDALRAA